MGTQQTKTELVISAIDKASTTLNEIGAKLEGMIKPAGDLHSAFGKLYDATGLGKVKSAVGALSKSLVGLGVATVGIGGVYAGTVGEILHFGVAAAEAADSVGDLAEKYQINAQRLQVFGELVKEDGGTMEDAAAAMGKLKKAMGLALAGGKEQQQAFAGVGISMAQLKGMKPEEVIERMADAFKGSNKDIAKQAVLLELMGKSGEIMMGTMNRGADGIREKYEQMTADDALGGAGEGRRIGSRLWLLAREKQLAEVVAKAREYGQEALLWLVEDGVVDSVQVEAQIVRQGWLGLGVTVARPKKAPAKFRFDFAWSNINQGRM